VPSEPAKFLARSTKLKHPSGVEVVTPLLVPSFSSKGFQQSENGVSAVQKALALTSEWLTDAMLLSAYDIAYEEIPAPEDLLCTPDLIILDSGGYEAGFDQDLSTAVVHPHEPKEWTQGHVRTVFDRWPDRFAAMFVSYDHPGYRAPVATQVEEARKLFGSYPNQLHMLLLKPETTNQNYLRSALAAVCKEPSLLSDFDCVGVTEKELGSSLLARMRGVAELRMALDASGSATPIQVFGALDPISACLYFVAGAEIFDGLTWLRYAYHRGLCVYRANYGATSIGLSTRDSLVQGKTMTDNLNQLQKLESKMRKVAFTQEFRHFEHHSALIEQAFGDLLVKLGEAN